MDTIENTFLNYLLDSVNDAVTGVNREGIVLYWNRAAEQMYGITKEQICGNKIGEFFQKGSVMLFQVMETGCPVYQVYHNPRPDMHVLINATPVYNEQSELVGAIAIEQDITCTVKLSEELYSKPNIQTTTASGRTIIQRNSVIKQIVQFLKQTSDFMIPILFAGEAGTGKQFFAHYLHTLTRKSSQFLTLNCEALPSGLLDAELFGYQEGVFGGKQEERLGKLDLAKEGILYIKNIHAMPLATQVRLANALREQQYYRIGEMKAVPLKCRILASASSELTQLVKDGAFSKELFYMFHVISIPPLKSRKEDIPELCHLFLTDMAQKLNKPVPRLSTEVIAVLTTYEWSGNLHELRNVMERVVFTAQSAEISLELLPEFMGFTKLSEFKGPSKPLADRSEEIERSMIEEALKQSNGNKANAARLLGISRGSLYYKLKQYRIYE